MAVTFQDPGRCGCVAPGLLCGSCSGLPTTLHATESNLGSAVLAWDGVSKWVGTSTFAFPGAAGVGCPAASVPLSWSLDSATCLLSISWGCTSNGIACCPGSGPTHLQVYSLTIAIACTPFVANYHTIASVGDDYNVITNGATAGTATVTP